MVSASGGRQTTDAGPLIILRDLQNKSESLFLENKTLQQEVQRLQSLHPVISQLPRQPAWYMRAMMRVVPYLRERHNLAMIEGSGLFEPVWYLNRYPDVRKSGQKPAQHFLTQGVKEWRDPGPHFSTAHYFRMYPDIAEGGINPLLHYLQSGWREGRSIRPGMRHGQSRHSV